MSTGQQVEQQGTTPAVKEAGRKISAEHADLDHTIPWADGGTTTLDNLAHLCRRHHMLKGATLAAGRAWKVRQLGHGVLEWTSPDGHVYVDQPPPAGPRFSETEDPWGTIVERSPDLPF